MTIKEQMERYINSLNRYLACEGIPTHKWWAGAQPGISFEVEKEFNDGKEDQDGPNHK